MTNPLVQLGRLGQSPWYDYITRDLVTSGELLRLIREDGLLGMTTNPTIFEKAIAGSEVYDADVRRLSAGGASPAEVVEAIAVADVRAACDLFAPVYQRTGGRDGLHDLGGRAPARREPADVHVVHVAPDDRLFEDRRVRRHAEQAVLPDQPQQLA